MELGLSGKTAPAARLNDAETAELSTLIHQLADRRGIGVLLVEHDMNLVMGVCDRIVVLNFGEILRAGDQRPAPGAG